MQHPWDVTPAEARAIQTRLAGHVRRENAPTLRHGVTTVAGVDASYKNGLARAAVAVLSYPALDLLTYTTAEQPIQFPYVPGLLSFREAPVVLKAIAQLTSLPDLFIVDSQGIAHPRRLGLASHLGVWLDVPTIGCAKSRLCGEFQPPPAEKGQHTSLRHRGETVGAVLRTRTNVKPVFISIGHAIDLPTAVQYVLSCCTRYRLPETTRWADRIAGGDRPTSEGSHV